MSAECCKLPTGVWDETLADSAFGGSRNQRHSRFPLPTRQVRRLSKTTEHLVPGSCRIQNGRQGYKADLSAFSGWMFKRTTCLMFVNVNTVNTYCKCQSTTSDPHLYKIKVNSWGEPICPKNCICGKSPSIIKLGSYTINITGIMLLDQKSVHGTSPPPDYLQRMSSNVTD